MKKKEEELFGYTGNGNTALGRDAAVGLDPDAEPDGTGSGGYYNTAVGHEAMLAADFAHRTTAIGRGALRDSTTGWLNVAIGTDAGRHTILGHRNTFVGSNAGKWVGSLDPRADNHPNRNAPGADPEFCFDQRRPNQGSRNTLIGRNSGHEGTQIQSCVAVGYNAGAHWLQNDATTVVGRNAMRDNGEAKRTVALGAFAMERSPSGADDTVAIGNEALRFSTGNNNVAVGAFAAERLADGGQNIFIGEQCAAKKRTGSDNVFIGRRAGEENEGGNGNIFIGRMAGRFEQGSNQLVVHNSSSASPFLKGSMGENGQWWLKVRGDVKPNQDEAWSLGSSEQRWDRVYSSNGVVSTSDASLKTAVQGDDLGLEFIRELRPVVWKWKDDPAKADHRGLVAQDVADVLTRFEDRRGFAGLVDEGGPMGLSMAEFIGPLVKAVQELDAKNAELERRLAALENDE